MQYKFSHIELPLSSLGKMPYQNSIILCRD